MTVADYYAKMRGYADEMASAGNPLSDEELVSYLLAGLDEEFNPVFTSVVARVGAITPGEVFSQLLSFEQHLRLQLGTNSGNSSSAMAASRGHGAPRSGGYGRGQDRVHGGFGRG